MVLLSKFQHAERLLPFVSLKEPLAELRLRRIKCPFAAASFAFNFLDENEEREAENIRREFSENS